LARCRLCVGPLLVAVVFAAARAGAEPSDAEKPAIEVEVRGQAPDRGPAGGDSTAASMVVRGEALRVPGRSSADLLEQIPGVQVRRTGSSSDLATASVRGATAAQLPVYLAGIRINDDVVGVADLSTLSLWMLDRVEVYRGNAPARADELGIGGAVFVEPAFPRTTRLGAGALVGSFGQVGGWVGGEVAAHGGQSGVERAPVVAGSLVMLRSEHADNDYPYVDDRGTRLVPGDDRVVRRSNADATSREAWAVGRYALGDGGQRLDLVMNGFEREQGVSGAGVVPVRRARARTRRLLAGIDARVPCSSATASRCRLELRTSGIHASETLSDPANELELLSPLVLSKGRRWGNDARLEVSVGDALLVSLGFGAEHSSLSIEREGASGLDARRDVGSATTTARWDASDAVEIFAIGRATCHITSRGTREPPCTLLAGSGRLGFSWQFASGLALVANAGRSSRVPTLGDLFGASAFVRGNRALLPETAIVTDVGVTGALRSSGNELRAEAFGFLRWVDDLIAYRRTSRGFLTPFNVGRARVAGVELAAGADVLRHVDDQLSLTLLDPRDVTPGRTLTNDLVPFQSRLVVHDSLELYVTDPFAGLDVSRLALGGDVTHRSARVADPAGLAVLAAESSVDGHVSALFFDRRLGIRVAVLNVLDARRLDVIGFPLPGRSIHATLEGWY
jgi:iron complex outermembrane receptor protein